MNFILLNVQQSSQSAASYVIEIMKRYSRRSVFIIHLIFKRLDFRVGAAEVPTELMIGGRFPRLSPRSNPAEQRNSQRELQGASPTVMSHLEIGGDKRIYQQLRVGAYLQLVAHYRHRATHLQQTSKVC